MAGPRGERCDGCYFFETQLYGGVCRLNPRRENVLTNGGLEPGALPIQHDFDWCGSWKPKPVQLVWIVEAEAGRRRGESGRR